MLPVAHHDSPWLPMVPNASQWPYLVSYGFQCLLNSIFGPKFISVAPQDQFKPIDSIRLAKVLCCSLWLAASPYGFFWFPIGPYDFLRLHIAPNGAIWRPLAPNIQIYEYGSLWLNLALFGSQWLNLTNFFAFFGCIWFPLPSFSSFLLL